MKKESGITLIALVITIIVMLILVGVTINVALNGGLIDKTNEAAYKTKVDQIRDALETKKSELYAASEGKPDFSNLSRNGISGLEIPETLKLEFGDKLVIGEDGNLYYNESVTDEKEAKMLSDMEISTSVKKEKYYFTLNQLNERGVFDNIDSYSESVTMSKTAFWNMIGKDLTSQMGENTWVDWHTDDNKFVFYDQNESYVGSGKYVFRISNTTDDNITIIVFEYDVQPGGAEVQHFLIEDYYNELIENYGDVKIYTNIYKD